jgi:hypothetical protein
VAAGIAVQAEEAASQDPAVEVGAQLDLEHLLGEWPRCGFNAEFPTCLERQEELKPDSHIAGAMGLGLEGRVRASPFAE